MTSDNKYFSIESPHKPRRKSYFWTIVVTLTVIAASIWFGVSLQTSSSSSSPSKTRQPSLSEPSSGLVTDSKSQEELSTHTQSYQVDMTKTSWPELVGVDAAVAKETIQGENPSITKIQILPKDSFVTMDYVTTRVRIFVDDDNSVASAPKTG